MKEFITKYGTLIVAALALVQPWLFSIWRKFFRKGRIDIFPSGTIEVGYSAFGPTIGLNGTFRCAHQDFFINSITLKIIKQKDNSTHFFDWGLFRSQKLTLKGEELEAELPYSLMLNAPQPKRYNILFFDTNTRDEMQTIIRTVRENWTKFILIELQKGTPLKEEIISNKYYSEFSKSAIHVEAYTKLNRLCYWESGNYSILLKVSTSKPNKVFEKSWGFSLKEEEVRAVRLNVVKMLQDALMVPSYGQYNFAYPRYEGV